MDDRAITVLGLMHTVDQRNDRHSCCKWFTCSAGFICAPTSSGACRRFLGLANLTEAVNKGCCWLDQTASTFWGKGWLLSNMDGDGVIGKQRVAAWNPWTCRSAVFLSGSGLLEGQQQPTCNCILMAFCWRCGVAWEQGIWSACCSLSGVCVPKENVCLDYIFLLDL